MTQVMNSNDVIRESLALALLRLMKRKDFSKISITEIVALAGVSRSSFYRNFESKEQLLCSYVVDLYRDYFSAQTLPVKTREEFLLVRFRFIKDHHDIFKALYKHGLLYFFFNQIQEDLVPFLCGQSSDISPYLLATCSGACAGVIYCWIQGGFRESAEEMVQIFLETRKGAME